MAENDNKTQRPIPPPKRSPTNGNVPIPPLPKPPIAKQPITSNEPTENTSDAKTKTPVTKVPVNKPVLPKPPVPPRSAQQPLKPVLNTENKLPRKNPDVKVDGETDPKEKREREQKKNYEANLVETKNDSRADNPLLNDLIESYKDLSKIKRVESQKVFSKKKYNISYLLKTKIEKGNFKPVYVFYNKEEKKKGSIAFISKIAKAKRKIVILACLIIALIIIGIGVGSVFIFRAKPVESNPIVFNNNIKVDLIELAFADGQGLPLPGSIIEVDTFDLIVAPDTETELHDIVCYAITFDIYTINKKQQKVSMIDYLLFNFESYGNVFNELEQSSNNDKFYYLNEKNKTLYFVNILGIGEKYKILNSIMIAREMTSLFAEATIYIDYTVSIAFPNEDQLTNGENVDDVIKTAPRKWKDLMIEKAIKYQAQEK